MVVTGRGWECVGGVIVRDSYRILGLEGRLNT